MIAAFFDWLESLGWQSVLCFAFALAIFCCIVILLCDAAFRRYIDRQELAAIKARTWDQRKEKLAGRIEEQRQREKRETDDAEFLRRLSIDIANDDAQGRRERQQFHVSPCFRDMKGLTK